MVKASSDSKTVQNDEIEGLGMERSAIYRKCRLEEVALPLREGSLSDIPMDEVSLDYYHIFIVLINCRISGKMVQWI